MRKITLLIGFVFIFSFIQAQKKPLDHTVYDAWQSIGNSDISKDGKWINYSISPQEGDSKLVLTTSKRETIKEADRAMDVAFTHDSKHLVFLIKAPFEELRQAKIKKKKPEEMPTDSLAIFSLQSKQLFKTSDVKSYKLAEVGSSFIAYLKKTTIDTSKVDTSDKKSKAAKPKEKEINDLFVRNLANGSERVFKNVESYNFNKAGNLLYFVQKATEGDSIAKDAGLYTYEPANQKLKHISQGKGDYKNITFDENGKQLAFTAYKGSEKSLRKLFNLYYYKGSADTAIILANTNTTGVPTDWSVSENGQIRFSDDGEKLFFGLAPIPAIKDTSLVDFETAKVDIWHWQDDFLQSQQLVNLKLDLSRSYLSVIYPAHLIPTVIALADETLPNTSLSKSANNDYVLATTDVGRRIESQWQTGTFQDVYLISTKDGKRIKIADSIRGTISLSPTGDYVIWFNRTDSSWYAYASKSGQTHQLNQHLAMSFSDEDFDMPDDPGPYGIAGWTKNDEYVFINDKYDIWAFDPDGKNSRNVTNGDGRRNKVTYRYIDLEGHSLPASRRSQDEPIELNKPIYLSLFDHLTKENGIAQVNPKTGKSFKTITKGPFTYRQLKAPKGISTFIYTKENYEKSPDLYVSSDFNKEIQLSSINQQQKDYNWGTTELVKWTTPKGYEAEGILYKPEDFDPSKKYPMISYFYEILSNGLYSYIPPAPTPSRLNISFFVSNGYLVFAPDIRYEIGYPGRSSEEYVNSGVEFLKERAYVDGDRIGIQGQSWGGYQVAHLITRTDMYAAAWSGAPVVNMTSAYGGIRWQSGMNRQFQYERTQSRIGETLWENPELYKENSPLFYLPNVNTPVVIMANDADGAVPWYQGIEMFTALRRLQKPVWMLNYNDDEHNLMKRQNRKDIQIREQQFFDHYLKGQPAPVWLERGVPATLKGIDWGLDLVN
jgi:dipeptidyl aminopeptidase/acylaminoacyl peptidase